MQPEKKEVFCIECGAYKQFAVKTTREEITVRGVTFSYLEQSAYCSECGEEVYVPEINDINVQARENAYRKESVKCNMKSTVYNKLVRDSIPDIIEAAGKSCTTRILNDEEYLKMLDAKLDEELAEYHRDQNVEELADLVEVIRACAVARGYTLDELEAVRSAKAAKRGGFEKKLFLMEVIEG